MGPQSAYHLSLSLAVIAAMVRGCPPLGRGGDSQPEHVAVTLLGPVWPVLLQRIGEASPVGNVSPTYSTESLLFCVADEELAHSFEKLVSVMMRSTGRAFVPLLPSTMNTLCELLKVTSDLCGYPA